YWEFLLFSCCFSPYFLHKKAGWRVGLTPATFLKFTCPVIGSRHPAKKTTSGDPVSYKKIPPHQNK
ncbi:hypothetical protein, partial [Enterobacter intestinihominis]